MPCFKTTALSLAALTFAASAHAAIIDSFDTTEGRFNLDPDGSGSNSGLSESADGTGPSTADRTAIAGEIFEGTGAEKLVLVSGGYFSGTTALTRTGFTLRFASGSNSPANNVAVDPLTNKFGVYAATTSSNIQISPLFDDSTDNERLAYQTLIGDGAYHFYEFDLSAAATFFAGTIPTGKSGTKLDATTVTLDSLLVTSAVAQPGDVTLFLDSVQYNATPEPTTIAALGLAGVTLVRRRRA